MSLETITPTTEAEIEAFAAMLHQVAAKHAFGPGGGTGTKQKQKPHFFSMIHAMYSELSSSASVSDELLKNMEKLFMDEYNLRQSAKRHGPISGVQKFSKKIDERALKDDVVEPEVVQECHDEVLEEADFKKKESELREVKERDIAVEMAEAKVEETKEGWRNEQEEKIQMQLRVELDVPSTPFHPLTREEFDVVEKKKSKKKK